MRATDSAIRFGQVWVSRDDTLGPMNYLVVSSDAYNASFHDRRVITVEVDSRALYEGVYREPIVDVGTALLDRLAWLAPSALHQRVSALHPSRHDVVAARIRSLIGND